MENAVLRERINDVAAEVARLTSALEGPASPINTMLNDADRAPFPPVNGEGLLPSLTPTDGSRGTLADRIRALQTRATVVPQSRSGKFLSRMNQM